MPAYEILAKLAQGATAELFAARATDRVVVLKRLRASGVDAAKAFLAESLVAATLDHPNIVKVFDVGALHGAYVVTREYVDGETLASLVAHARRKKIQVPLRAILTIAAGTAEGLQYAHERSMHADLSLPSVIVSHDGVVKLLEVTGADRGGDLVALGRALWELLTLGDSSVSPDNAAALPAPSKTRFDIPQELDTIVVHLLAGEYESADDVMGAIDRLAAKLGFQLSTAELSRMMRLWFAPPPESPHRPLVPVSVTTEPVGHDAAPAITEPTGATAATGATDPLAAVRDDDDARHAVAALVTTRLRHERITAVPGFGEVDATREHFEKIRDRILEHARKKKETRPPIPAGAFPSNAFAPARSETDAPFAVAVESTPPPGSVAIEPAPGEPAPGEPAPGEPAPIKPAPIKPAPGEPAPGEPATAARRKPDTLDPGHNAYAYITKVAETASAPTKTITKGELGAANAALQATDAASGPADASDTATATGRVSTLRMGEVIARPAPQTEPRVVESSPVKLGADIAAELASSKPPIGDPSLIAAPATATGGSSPEDETVVIDEGALPRSPRAPSPPLASVAAERLGDARSPHTRRTAEMVAIDVKAVDAQAALVDARSPDVKARENAKTTAQIKAVDVQDIANFEADAARLAYAKAINDSAKAGGAASAVVNETSATSAGAESAASNAAGASGIASVNAKASRPPGQAMTVTGDATRSSSSTDVSGMIASSNTRPVDAKAGDAKAGDANAGDAKAGDAEASDANASDAKASDAKASDAKASDAKASDAKGSDAGAASSTSTDAKGSSQSASSDPKTASAREQAAEAPKRGTSTSTSTSPKTSTSTSTSTSPKTSTSTGTGTGTGTKTSTSTGTKTSTGTGSAKAKGKRSDVRHVNPWVATPIPDEGHEGSGKGWLIPGLLMIAIAAGITVFAKRDDEKPNAARASVAVAPTTANGVASPIPGRQAGAGNPAPTETRSAANVATAETPTTNDEATALAADRAMAQKADEETVATLAAEQATRQKADEKADKKAAKVVAEQAAEEKAADERAAKLAAEHAAKEKAADERAAKLAAEQAAKQKAADEKVAKLAAEQAAKQKAADQKAAKLAEQAAKQKAADEKAAKLAAGKAIDKPATVAAEKSVRASAKPADDGELSIEDTYAAGAYEKTNAACTANAVFTAKKLELCALAACRTSNTALAKRWVNAIAKASRDDVVAQCKALGLDLAPAPPPAATTAPAPLPPATAAPAPSAEPPAESNTPSP